MSYTILPAFGSNSIGYNFPGNGHFYTASTNATIFLGTGNNPICSFFDVGPGVYLFNAVLNYFAKTSQVSSIPIWETFLSTNPSPSTTSTNVSTYQNGVSNGSVYAATASISYVLNVQSTQSYYVICNVNITNTTINGINGTTTTNSPIFSSISLTRIA